MCLSEKYKNTKKNAIKAEINKVTKAKINADLSCLSIDKVRNQLLKITTWYSPVLIIKTIESAQINTDIRIVV